MIIVIQPFIIETLIKDIAILASADIYNYVKVAKIAKFKCQKTYLIIALKSWKLVHCNLSKLPAGLQSFKSVPLILLFLWCLKKTINCIRDIEIYIDIYIEIDIYRDRRFWYQNCKNYLAANSKDREISNTALER